MKNFQTKKKRKFFLLFGILCLIIYKYLWSAIGASWREDEATVIWIANNFSILNTPLGLVSSVGIPNPNLLVLISKPLTIFNSLIQVSTVFALLNIIFIYCALKDEQKGYKNILLIFLIGFSSYISQSSLEPWGQSFLIITNSLFIYVLFGFVIEKKYYLFPLFPVVILIPSSIYLGGLTNSVVYSLFFLFFSILYIKQIKKYFSNNQINIASFISCFLLLRFTWIPFFKKVSLNSISEVSNSWTNIYLIFIERYKNTVRSIFGFWVDERSYYFPTMNVNNVSESTFDLFLIYLRLHWFLQRYVLFHICLILILLMFLKKNLNMSHVSKVFLLIFYLILFTATSPAIGGREFLKFQRMDNYVETYFIFIFVWFYIGYSYRNFRFSRFLTLFNSSLIILFTIFNIYFSYNILFDNFDNQSNKLAESDVPMIHKQQVIEFVAEDWKNLSDNNNIPVYYELGGGTYDWVNDFGANMSKYYSSNPYTIGRSFDYIFQKKYKLINSQEGLQFRSLKNTKYIIAYTFSPIRGAIYDNYEELYFGRLRLLINKNFDIDY